MLLMWNDGLVCTNSITQVKAITAAVGAVLGQGDTKATMNTRKT